MIEFEEISSMPYVFRRYVPFIVTSGKAVFSTSEYKDFRRLLDYYGRKAYIERGKNPFVSYRVGSFTGITFFQRRVSSLMAREIVNDIFREVYGKDNGVGSVSFSGSLVLRLYADIDEDAERYVLDGREVVSH